MTTRLRTTLLALAFASAAALGAAAEARAEALRVVAVDASEYPRVTLRVAVDPPTARPLTLADFEVLERGRPVRVEAATPGSPSFGSAAVVLVIDTSGSMRGQPLAAAREAATAFVSAMRPGDRVGLVSFGTSVRLAVGMTEDAGAVRRTVASLAPRGNTALYDAILAGLATLKGVPADARVLVALTDGLDNASKATPRDCLREARARGVTVYAVGLGPEGAKAAALKELAAATGGRFVAAPRPSELVAIYEGISREVYGRYAISYRSEAADAERVAVTVRVRTPAGVLEAVSAFRNPSAAVPTTAAARPEPSRIASALPPPVWMLLAMSLFGVAVALTTLFALSSWLARRDSLPARLKVYERAWRSQPDARGEEASGFVGALARALSAVFRKRGLSNLIFAKLEEAGVALRVSEFIFFHLASVVLLGAVGYALSGMAGAVAFIALGAFLPVAYLDYAAQKRRERFEELLPDTLMLLAGSLRAGYSLAQAIEFAEKELQPPISTEFRRVTKEARLGLPLEEALTNLAARVRSVSLEWVVTAINIQKEVGGNLAELLEKVADTLRQREVFNRQVRALSAEGRLSAVILTVLPFFQAAVLMVVNPSYLLTLFSHPVGLVMVAVALALMVAGWVWLRKVVTIDV